MNLQRTMQSICDGIGFIMKKEVKMIYKKSQKTIYSRIFLFMSFFMFIAMPQILNAEILFFNDFDDNTIGKYLESEFDGEWNTNFIKVRWKKDLSNCAIVGGADAFSGKSMRVRYAAGQYSGGSGFQMLADLETHNELYISYWIKFKADFDFVKGGKLAGLAGGPHSGAGEKDGTDGFSARLHWKYRDKDRRLCKGCIDQYVYHPDQPTSYGESQYWDDGIMGQITAEPGEWHHFEVRVKINTPGKNDGIIQGWYDGVLATERTNYRFRDVNTFAIDTFRFQTFFGGGDSSYAPSKDEYIYWDNFIISTHRVGPVAQNNPQLNAPANLRALIE